MKLIEIQEQFFRLKNRNGVFFCTEAETDACLNVKAVHYIQADSKMRLPQDWQNARTMTLRGDDLQNIVPMGGGLGMAYQPASKIRKLDTQTPDSMGNDIHSALAKLTKAVGGDVTDFVCERLQWSREEIEERLFAEQVDAVALIIYNFEARGQAMIVGDQTGIGKGRVASSIIRYAIVHNLIPVYCTENAGLFSDNYRDLCDIGCADLNPFIINSSTSGTTNACITTLDENDENVVVHRPITNKKAKEAIFRSGKLPAGYDYVLTTYSQLKNAYKKTKDGTEEGSDISKYYFLLDLAPNAVFIFDESHNISGSKAVSEEWWNPDAPMTMGGSNQFYCFNELCKKSKYAVFLSATFAKRPENLVVYAGRTCIIEAGLKDVELIQAISDGGEALQEIISSDIVGEGQMIRRESIYKNIKVNYIYLDKTGEKEFGTPDLEKQHRSMSDYVTDIINEINKFEQDYVQPIIDNMNSNDWGDRTRKTSEKTGAKHTPLFSKLFNIVNQLLFSIKAEAVADHAIRRLNEGKKVVIGLSSTMEAFVKTLLDEDDDDDKDGLKGLLGIDYEKGEISCDFALVLDKALDNTLKYTTDGEGGYHVKDAIDVSELSPDGQDEYLRLKNRIAAASSGISISPIDIIVQKIEAAVNPETGEHWRVTEVTGRKHYIRFTNKQGTRGVIEPRKKLTRNIAFSQFQNNQSDVLIINASGATGASAHATTKNTNLRPEQVKPRVMIIAQTELDVNKEVQKRGRINRTGQIKTLPPSYDYLISAIPAEKRLMMMLQKKLKSLDANSTSNQKQSTTVIDVPDFFNKYGNRIAYDYLIENPLINAKLNDAAKAPEKEDGKADVPGDFLKKVSGYVPLLTCEEQEDFYNTILDNYLKYIDNLKKKGEYDLEVEAMDLDAELIGELKPLVGASAGESKFADAAYQGTYRCKVLRKPYSQGEVTAMLRNYCGNSDGKTIAKTLADDFRKYYTDELEADRLAMKEAGLKAIEDARKSIAKKGGSEADKNEAEALVKENYRQMWADAEAKIERKRSKARFIEFFYAGRACIVDGDTNTRAICLGAEIGNKAKNKYAPSNISISFAVASSVKSLEYNIADKDTRELEAIMGLSAGISGGYYDTTDYGQKYLENWPQYCKEATSDTELRVIIVGNILRGYKSAPEHSKLISFTTHDGNVLKGLLVPKQAFDDDKGNSTTTKLLMTKYSVLKFKPVMERMFGNYGEKQTVNLTRGMKLDIEGGSFTLRCTVQATFKKLEKLQDWLDISPDGRGFVSKSDNWQIRFYDRDRFDAVCELLEKYQFQVELQPIEAERYFGKQTHTLKQGNWKPLKTDPANIPATGENGSAQYNNGKRTLQLAKAKEKARQLLKYAQRYTR
ncbi:MAG: strawberry notch C-terminal domain-containing protein [Salinivirgaceae bacterium]|nr:strawberry notch C-terminal domain-containing protein [Salinivirgaceae bacterium]